MNQDTSREKESNPTRLTPTRLVPPYLQKPDRKQATLNPPAHETKRDASQENFMGTLTWPAFTFGVGR